MSSTQEAGSFFGQGSGPAHAMMRSPTVLIASIGLWGMNVYFFRLFGIDYVKVLKHDLILLDGEDSHNTDNDNARKQSRRDNHHNQHSHHHKSLSDGSTDLRASSHTDFSSEDDMTFSDEEAFIMEGASEPASSITWFRLVILSLVLIVMLLVTYVTWIVGLGGGPVGAVFAFYATVAIAISLPIPQLHWLRRATVLVLQRAYELFNPRCSSLVDAKSAPRPIPFVDVFFADAMCSLSKVFFDWGILVHMASNPETTKASARNILIPSILAAIPYLIRARQCLVMYRVDFLKGDKKRFQHLWNALKYSTSIFPLLLSAYSKTLSPRREQDLQPHLLVLLVINALYALYWDVVMDWGMMQNPLKANNTNCGRALLRPRLRFGFAMSALIVVADSVLRFSWLLRFSKNLFPSEDSFVLCTQFLEVFRRAIWNLLRVEWENLKHTKAQLAEDKIALVRTNKGHSRAPTVSPR